MCHCKSEFYGWHVSWKEEIIHEAPRSKLKQFVGNISSSPLLVMLYDKHTKHVDNSLHGVR